MPRNPIEQMIDAALRCLKCGKAPSDPACRCWVKLTCRGCGKSKLTERDKTDPPETARVDVLCPDCDDGGNKPEVFYFDRSGRQIMEF